MLILHNRNLHPQGENGDVKNRDGVSCQLVILIFSSFHHHQFITNSKMIKCVHNQVKINHIDIPMGDIEKNESTYADSSIGEGMDITIQVEMMMMMIKEGMKHQNTYL